MEKLYIVSPYRHVVYQVDLANRSYKDEAAFSLLELDVEYIRLWLSLLIPKDSDYTDLLDKYISYRILEPLYN